MLTSLLVFGAVLHSGVLGVRAALTSAGDNVGRHTSGSSAIALTSQ